MTYPVLKFRIDYKKDVTTFFAFVRESGFDDGRNLEWAIFRKYPFFKKYKAGNTLKIERGIVNDFVKSMYVEQGSIIKENLTRYQKRWGNLQECFYELTSQLFPRHYWPKGKYVAYPTIWGMYPRFLETKTFQIPHKHKNKGYVMVIIAHEMLHFLFYDYFYKNFPQYKASKYDFFVWNISEIFNTIIQNSSEWLKVFKVKSMGYPEHNQVREKLQKKYYNQKELKVKDLIKDIIQGLKLEENR